MDFLQNRSFYVEVDNVRSKSLNLDRGCVQGSVLGPKLFSLYLGKLESILKDINSDTKLITFADDSYVILKGKSDIEVKLLAEKTLAAHVAFLKNLGMTVNESKTEIMWISRKNVPIAPIIVGNDLCEPTSNMKALGVYIDNNLSWDTQATHIVDKGKKLASIFRYLRGYMTEDQFLKTVSANFYSKTLYCSSVWLPNIKSTFKTKLNSIHFRMLRTAAKDYQLKLTKDELSTRCKRASPMEWAKYSTASVVIKTLRDKQPVVIHDLLQSTYYFEKRNRGRGLFFDMSRTRLGRQSIENRLAHIAQISTPWNEDPKKNNNEIRILLKNTFFSHKWISGFVGDLSSKQSPGSSAH